MGQAIPDLMAVCAAKRPAQHRRSPVPGTTGLEHPRRNVQSDGVVLVLLQDVLHLLLGPCQLSQADIVPGELRPGPVLLPGGEPRAHRQALMDPGGPIVIPRRTMGLGEDEVGLRIRGGMLQHLLQLPPGRRQVTPQGLPGAPQVLVGVSADPGSATVFHHGHHEAPDDPPHNPTTGGR